MSHEVAGDIHIGLQDVRSEEEIFAIFPSSDVILVVWSNA
jgi:hypothetical protein